jgi:hypothetical protein
MSIKLFVPAIAAALSTLPALSLADSLKPRIVVLTDIVGNDIEPDDMESTIRLFAHADLFEIEGLVITTGWSQSGGKERIDLMNAAIDAYEQDLPNLRKRSEQATHDHDDVPQPLGYWPSPAYLRARTMLGSRKQGFDALGSDNDSPGSELIIKLADEDDPRPLWVLAWGGGNTLAQAIWRVKEDRSPEELKHFLQRVRIYTITDQDMSYQNRARYDISSHLWMRREFARDLKFLWDESAWKFQNATGSRNWGKYAEHIQNHGQLGRLYPKFKYGVEGDTPSFLYVTPNGLNNPENPGAVGTGGTFVWAKGPDGVTEAFTNHERTPVHATSRRYEQRFYPAVFNDFAARMDWAHEGRGNRNPLVTINDHDGVDIIRIAPAAGDSIVLDATQSTDPDNDQLSFSWWLLPEAGDYREAVSIADAQSSRLTVKVPEDASGKEFHLICEVTDDGAPPLTSYRRIVIAPTANASTE